MPDIERTWTDAARAAGRNVEQVRHWEREDARPGYATDAEKIALLSDAYRGAVNDDAIERACRAFDPEWDEHTPEGEATWDRMEAVLRAAIGGQ